LIEKSIKNLKKEIHELEDLVAAIIEEFEDIADANINKDQRSEIPAQTGEFPVRTDDSFVTSGESPVTTQGLMSDYPTVGDFLDNLAENDLQQTAQAVKTPKKPFPFVDEDNNTFNKAAKPFHTTVAAVQETGEELDQDQPEIPTPDAGNKEPEVVFAMESSKSSKSEGTIQLESVNDPRHKRILELREQGMTVEDMARQLGTGRGEILLVLGLYRRN
jgi:hypothetical protein